MKSVEFMINVIQKLFQLYTTRTHLHYTACTNIIDRDLKLYRHTTSCLNVINDKFIVAQNVQNNKQMDSP